MTPTPGLTMLVSPVQVESMMKQTSELNWFGIALYHVCGMQRPPRPMVINQELDTTARSASGASDVGHPSDVLTPHFVGDEAGNDGKAVLLQSQFADDGRVKIHVNRSGIKLIELVLYLAIQR